MNDKLESLLVDLILKHTKNDLELINFDLVSDTIENIKEVFSDANIKN